MGLVAYVCTEHGAKRFEEGLLHGALGDGLFEVEARLEKRADCLEGVAMEPYRVTAYELRQFARMVRAARDYLAKRG